MVATIERARPSTFTLWPRDLARLEQLAREVESTKSGVLRTLIREEIQRRGIVNMESEAHRG